MTPDLDPGGEKNANPRGFGSETLVEKKGFFHSKDPDHTLRKVLYPSIKCTVPVRVPTYPFLFQKRAIVVGEKKIP